MDYDLVNPFPKGQGWNGNHEYDSNIMIRVMNVMRNENVTLITVDAANDGTTWKAVTHCSPVCGFCT